jgi:hypothetical protein
MHDRELSFKTESLGFIAVASSLIHQLQAYGEAEKLTI